MRTSGLEVDSDVARSEPLTQIIEPLKQIVKPPVNSFFVFGALDGDTHHPVARSPNNRSDQIARRRIRLHNIAQRDVVGEERNATDLKHVLTHTLGPELFEVVASPDLIERRLEHEARRRPIDRVRMRSNLVHGAVPYVLFHQFVIRDDSARRRSRLAANDSLQEPAQQRVEFLRGLDLNMLKHGIVGSTVIELGLSCRPEK